MYAPHACLMPSGTGVTGGCEPPCGYWKQDLGPLREQLVPLPADTLLQTAKICLLNLDHSFGGSDWKWPEELLGELVIFSSLG